MQLLDNPYTFWGGLIAANILMYLCTIAISYTWSKVYNHTTLALTKPDVINSILIVLINIVIAIPGYYLYINEYIRFTIDTNFFLDFAILFFTFDLVMYLLHLVSHFVWPFNKFHKKHHAHKFFNAISLYVMAPSETFLFGLLLTVCAFFIQLNIYSFLAFIFLNWALGVIGHLNTQSTKQPLLFGNHVFHKTHHQQANQNFGFYTVIWDKIFGTYYKPQ